MINLEEKYLSEVKNILAKHLRKDEKVYVFGSRITDKYKKYSDLDLAVNTNDIKIEPKILSQLITDFDDSLIPIKVDVIDLNDISEEFKRIILNRFEQLQF